MAQKCFEIGHKFLANSPKIPFKAPYYFMNMPLGHKMSTSFMPPIHISSPLKDLSAEKIVVLDLDDSAESEFSEAPKNSPGGKSWREGQQQNQGKILN